MMGWKKRKKAYMDVGDEGLEPVVGETKALLEHPTPESVDKSH